MVGRGSERVEVLDIDGSELLLNLSTTGVAFLHSGPLEENRSVTLTINEVRVEGQVVYCHQRTDSYRIGVRFNTVTTEEQAAVRRMVDSFSCGVPLRFSFEISPLKQQHL
ncbi:MAG: PilZ domain-containing protein [Chitinispirillaceae bacterium]|nr:PilZ domain-containing protein [Chitinispirillaceae bacterium]